MAGRKNRFRIGELWMGKREEAFHWPFQLVLSPRSSLNRLCLAWPTSRALPEGADIHGRLFVAPSGMAAFNNSFGLMRIALEYVKIPPRSRIHI